MKSYRPKKRFGQNFIRSKSIARKIIDGADIAGKKVLEIGAGKGILTKLCSEYGCKIFAVEIDRDLVTLLEKMKLPNVEVINSDFLKIDLKDYEYSVVIGNIPFSITTQILEKLAHEKKHFSKAVLTIQKEYGARVLAKVGSAQYGSITVFLRYHFGITRMFAIAARFFAPRPKVSSTVITLTPKKEPFVLHDKKAFFEMVKGVFCYRRKLLKNALINYLHYSSGMFDKSNYDKKHDVRSLPKGISQELLDRRPGELSLEDFYNIYKCLKK